MKTGRRKGFKHSKKTKQKISNSHKGLVLSDESKRKISRELLEKKNPNWKGGIDWYKGLHKWISKKQGKPKYCEHCKRTDKKKYEWANKDHKYRRRIKDFMRLCTSCHQKYDIKLNNYKKY